MKLTSPVLVLAFTSNAHLCLTFFNFIPHVLLVLCAFGFPEVNQSGKMESPRHTFVSNNKEVLLALGSLEGDDDGWSSCKCFPLVREKIKNCWFNLQDFAEAAWEMGRSDPQKIIFGIKMGLALSIVSLLIFWRESYHDVSQYSIWAILTVIVMFEFSIGMTINILCIIFVRILFMIKKLNLLIIFYFYIGATFIKGFNRGLGTLCAGILAFCFAELSLLAGKWEQVVIVISTFITGTNLTHITMIHIKFFNKNMSLCSMVVI
jgi:hypothetical protein